MKQEFVKQRNVNQFKLIPGVVGLTALAFLNILEPVDAASFTCGSGTHWMDTCPSGSYDFFNSVTINVNFGINPNNQPDFTTTLLGTSRVFLGNPIDAVIGDPLLGDVGRMDGHQDVIQTEISKLTVTGPTLLRDAVNVRAGDGIPDLQPTPFDSTLPYESLYSAGAILERQDNSALADSFFYIFFEVQNTFEGTLRNRYPITLRGTTPIFGFPPSRIDYVSTDVTSLFTAGSDGSFWTGDETEVARFVPDDSGRAVILTFTPVPEPSGIASVVTGLAIIFGLRRKKLGKKP
jgi:hypothetical protein